MTAAGPVALTIAGSDSGGGAGVTADAATFAALGVWATVAITAVTAQNTAEVRRVEVLAPALVRAQIEAVAEDMTIGAVKIGMLGDAAVAAEVAAALTALGLPAPVLDPVLRATSGGGLGSSEALVPLIAMAAVVTPNAAEAEALTGIAVGDQPAMEAAGRALVARGAGAALVTGGHVPGPEVADCLVHGDGTVRWFRGPRLEVADTHGTGCVLSAAIAAGLAGGLSLGDACDQGVRFVRAAIGRARRLGSGSGPIDPAAAGQDLSWRA